MGRQIVEVYREASPYFATHFDDDWSLHIHHYLASSEAALQ